jgi:hypothetical protein
MQFFLQLLSPAALMMTEMSHNILKSGVDKTVFAETERFSYIIDVMN